MLYSETKLEQQERWKAHNEASLGFFQTAPEGTYTGIQDVFKKLMLEEGPKGLYRGWLPVMMRAVPANAFCFLSYEATMKLLNENFPEKSYLWRNLIN